MKSAPRPTPTRLPRPRRRRQRQADAERDHVEQRLSSPCSSALPVEAKNGALGADPRDLDLDLLGEAVAEDRAQDRLEQDEEDDAAQRRDHDQEDPPRTGELGQDLRQLLPPVAWRRPRRAPTAERQVEQDRHEQVAPEPLPRHVEPAPKRGQEAVTRPRKSPTGGILHRRNRGAADRYLDGVPMSRSRRRCPDADLNRRRNAP